jgi:C-terminal processing protease CtpA/Prc
VAYALQQDRHAYVIGEQSAGAVVGARPFPLAGGAFFITGAFIDVGPGNKVLDKIGVTPDKKVALDLDLLQREGRDSQLEAATSYLKQKLGR